MKDQQKRNQKKKQSLHHKEESGGFWIAIKGAWKILLSIGVALALVVSILNFDARYFKTADAQSQKQESLKSFEMLQKSLGQQSQQTELQFLQQDEKRLYDRERSLKRDLAKSPKDKTILDELQETQKEREDVKKQISDLKNRMR